MTIHTTYFGGLGNIAHPAPADHVVGVVRYPRPFVDEIVDRNMSSVAPHDGLLEAFKNVESAAERNGDPNPSRVAWETVDFERRYLEWLKRSGQQAGLRVLSELARENDLWLVCWEKDVRYCHRRLLAFAIAERLQDVDVGIEHHPTIEVMAALEEADDDPDDVVHASLSDYQTTEVDGGQI